MAIAAKNNNKKWLVTALGFLSISLSFNGYSSSNELEEFELILAGGGLSTCSSMSEKNCSVDAKFSEVLTEINYHSSQKSKNKLQQFIQSANFSEQDALQLNSIITNLYSKYAGKSFNKSELRKAIKRVGVYQEYNQLSDRAYYALLDFLEHRQTDKQKKRLREQVNLAANKNRHSLGIYQTFYDQAKLKSAKKGKQKPKLVAITASSRDPFESADFYSGVLSNFDADVLWLPLDRSLQLAWQQGSQACAELSSIRAKFNLFNRESIYPQRVKQQVLYCQQPELLLAELQLADGLFLNGGDQSKTLAAFTNQDGTANAALQLIKQQVKNKQLVVAGTSAGTAVQAGGHYKENAIAMLSNGSPKNALSRGAFAAQAPSVRCSEQANCAQQQLSGDDLTYNQNGGLGLFSLGLLDTHFSERDREVRLAVFNQLSGSRFAFGVDEATALLVSHSESKDINMKVVGENGVFIIDAKGLPYRVDDSKNANYVSGISYFVNHGVRLTYLAEKDELVVNWPSTSTLLKDKQRGAKPSRKGQWRQHITARCGTKDKMDWALFDVSFNVKAGPETQFSLNRNNQCSYQKLPFVISQ